MLRAWIYPMDFSVAVQTRRKCIWAKSVVKAVTGAAAFMLLNAWPVVLRVVLCSR
jgi:hypothetical protein